MRGALSCHVRGIVCSGWDSWLVVHLDFFFQTAPIMCGAWLLTATLLHYVGQCAAPKPSSPMPIAMKQEPPKLHTPGIEAPCSPTGEMLADGWTEHTYHPTTTHSPMINDKLLRASDGEVIATS